MISLIKPLQGCCAVSVSSLNQQWSEIGCKRSNNAQSMETVLYDNQGIELQRPKSSNYRNNMNCWKFRCRLHNVTILAEAKVYDHADFSMTSQS